jgi:hypothetical protein
MYNYNLAPRSLGSAVGLATGCGLDGRGVGVRIPIWAGSGTGMLS